MFLMPWILFGGLLAAIPILVHLLHRQKVQPIAWGAMQFLLETPLKIRRRRKIDNWLLMLVRIAILLVLVLLLARPTVKTAEVKTSTPLDLAVVIDYSMTMAARTGAAAAGSGGGAAGATLYQQAVDVTERVARMLPNGATISIVLAENAPRIATPAPLKMGLTERDSDGQPRGAWATTLEVLRKMSPGMSKANIPVSVAAARDLVLHGNNTRKLVLVLSDNQRSNWAAGEEAPWKLAEGMVDSTSDASPARPVIPVYDLPLAPAPGSSTPANVSLRGISILPAFVGVHRPAEILATVSNSGTVDLSTIPLKLFVDGAQVSTQNVAHLAVGESVTVRFDYYFPEAGSHWVKVQSDLIDALEADNVAYGAVRVWPKLKVLVVDGQLTAGGSYPQAEFLEAAMQPVDPTIDPVSLIDPRIISVSELNKVALQDYPVVILNDVPRLTAATVDALSAHALAGGGVWMILGPRTEQGFLRDVMAKSQLAPFSTKGITRAPVGADGVPAAPVTVDIREPANPAIALLTDSGEHSALADVTLRAWWNVAPLAPELRPVLATATGDPLVLEMNTGKLGGHVVVWMMPVGNLQWSNLPLVASFVPLVNETLFHLASGQDAGEPPQVDTGSPIVWTGPAAQPIDRVTLISPDGQSHTLHPEIRGDHYVISTNETAQPGLYEMRFSAPPVPGMKAPPTVFYAVNIDRAELDPALLSSGDLEWLKEHGFLKGVVGVTTVAKALDATQGGYDLWWLLGILLLAFLLVEVAMTYVLVRRQSGAALAEEGRADVLPAGVVPAEVPG